MTTNDEIIKKYYNLPEEDFEEIESDYSRELKMLNEARQDQEKMDYQKFKQLTSGTKGSIEDWENRIRQDEREKKPSYHHLDTDCDACKAVIFIEKKQTATTIFAELDKIFHPKVYKVTPYSLPPELEKLAKYDAIKLKYLGDEK